MVAPAKAWVKVPVSKRRLIPDDHKQIANRPAALAATSPSLGPSSKLVFRPEAPAQTAISRSASQGLWQLEARDSAPIVKLTLLSFGSQFWQSLPLF
jgi:hypothetical protein